MRYRLKHILEYTALRVMAWPLAAMPYKAALFVGWFGAWVVFHLFRFRAAEAFRRIRLVFGERFSEQEVRRIAWQSWCNIVFVGIEMIRAPRITREWIDSVSDFKPVISRIKKLTEAGKGAVIVTCHTGSWELAALSCHFHGIPIFTLAATQKNPLVDRYMNMIRTSHGMRTVARGSGTMKEVLRRLKHGEAIAILPDVRVRSGGISIPFLGGNANVGTGLALFARHADIPIFVAIGRRDGLCKLSLKGYDPIIYPDKSLDKDQDVRRMTASVLRIIEDEIRRDPGQWFWFNKRWILDPIE